MVTGRTGTEWRTEHARMVRLTMLTTTTVMVVMVRGLMGTTVTSH